MVNTVLLLYIDPRTLAYFHLYLWFFSLSLLFLFRFALFLVDAIEYVSLLLAFFLSCLFI